jgi:putative glycosyltransferase (TIGR04372 family)
VDHLLIRSSRGQCLLVDVHCSADGKGIGYGMMLIRMRRALLAAQLQNAAVCFVRPGKAMNAAVMRLRSDEVEIVSPDSWRGWSLRWVWAVSAPFRAGRPWLWLQHSLARVLLGPAYVAVKRSRLLPRVLRRRLTRRGPLIRLLKSVEAHYASRVQASWHRMYERQVLQRLHDLKRAHKLPPPIQLRLPSGLEQQAVSVAARLGIAPDTPIVTVHVRESGYRAGGGLSQRPWDNSRNADVCSYFKAFAALIERGYTVVRLGDASMAPVHMPGVVDLATSPARSDALEVWCTLRSAFMVGCDSGPSWLAVLLGVPVLTVNAVHFRDLSRERDRIICKLVRDRALGRTLSVSEMLTEDYLRVGLKSGRFEGIDNTMLDIRDAVLDMVSVAQGCEERSPWQRKFNRRLRDLRRSSALDWSALDGVGVMGRARGTLSKRFAEKHFSPRAYLGARAPAPPPSLGRSNATPTAFRRDSRPLRSSM